jgi:divalent metal cation (Fe/Co/Zn/Cd) transporter
MKLAQAHTHAEALKTKLREEMGPGRVDVHLEPLEPDLVMGEDVTASRSALVADIKRIAGAYPGVLSCRDVELSQRAGGTVAYVAIELAADLSLEQAHAAESEVERAVAAGLPELRAVVAEAVVDLK